MSLAALAVARSATMSNRPIDTRRWLVPAFYGALLPDLVDKSILVLDLSPYGRTVGHSLPVYALFVTAWLVFYSRESTFNRLPPSRRRPDHSATLVSSGWLLVGWLSHFVADFVDDLVAGLHYDSYLVSGWYGWPWVNPDMWVWETQPLSNSCHECLTVVEIATIAGALYVFRKRQSHKASPPLRASVQDHGQ